VTKVIPSKPESKELESILYKKSQTVSNSAKMIPFIFTKAKIVNIEYSDAGYEEQIRYYDAGRKPVAGPDNAYGQKREFDDYGRMIRQTSIDQNGKNND